jgi:hypothetical protein
MLHAIHEEHTTKTFVGGERKAALEEGTNINLQQASGFNITSLSARCTIVSLFSYSPASLRFRSSLLVHVDFSHMPTFFFTAEAPAMEEVPFGFPMSASGSFSWSTQHAQKALLLNNNVRRAQGRRRAAVGESKVTPDNPFSCPL